MKNKINEDVNTCTKVDKCKDSAIIQKCELDSCLFFSTAKLFRALGKTADESFKVTGLSPSYALLLYIVNQHQEIPQKEIGELLHLTPSTITRFIEKLESKKLLSRKTEGKCVFIKSTEKGIGLQPDIEKAWHNLHIKFEDALSQEETIQFIMICNKLLDNVEKYED